MATSFPLTRPFRRGRKFGTILVDLQTRQVIEGWQMVGGFWSC